MAATLRATALRITAMAARVRSAVHGFDWFLALYLMGKGMSK